MKKYIAVIAIVALLSSCGKGDRGELVGAKGKRWNPEKPYGMTLVSGGAYIMGKSDDDFAAVNDAPTKTVTVRSFYMDETEITNEEYRQFVEWVKDSIVRTRLAILADELGETPGAGDGTGIGDFAFSDADPDNMTPYEQYMYDNYYGLGETGFEGRKLNKDIDIIWDTAEYPDEYYAEVMDTMYIPLEEAYNGQRTIDVDKLEFRYTYLDIQEAAKKNNGRRKDHIKTETVKV